MFRKVVVAMLMAVSLVFAAAVCFAEDGALSLDDYTVIFDGETYAVPVSYRDFTAAGWTSEAIKAEDILPATCRRAVVSFRYRDVTCSADLINWDISSRAVEECYLSSLCFYSSQPGQFVLPGGIDFGVSTREDIVRIFGTPDRETSYSITYGDYDRSWTFEFDNKELLHRAEVTNTTRPDAFVNAPLDPGEPDDVQAIISGEKVFSDDISLLTFRLDGDVYRLPVQVKELLGNGWEIESAEDEYVGSGDYSYITLRHGGEKKRFYIQNHSARAAKPEYCFITELDFGRFEPFTLELGGKITIGAPVENLLVYLPEGFAPNEEYRYYSFVWTYGENSYNYASFLISYDEENIITGIRMEYKQRGDYLNEFIRYYEENTGK